VINRQRKTILDVGCGHGTWLQFLLDNVPNASDLELYGIDISKARIEIGQKQLKRHANINLLVEDIRTYEPRRTFDLVFFAEALQFIPDVEYEFILRRCHDLLSDDGILVVVDKERWSWLALRVTIRRRLGQLPPESTYVRYPNFAFLRRIATKMGFAVQDFVKIREFRGIIFGKK